MNDFGDFDNVIDMILEIDDEVIEHKTNEEVFEVLDIPMNKQNVAIIDKMRKGEIVVIELDDDLIKIPSGMEYAAFGIDDRGAYSAVFSDIKL